MAYVTRPSGGDEGYAGAAVSQYVERGWLF